MAELTCSAPGCDVGAGAPFKTPKMASSDAMLLLKMHREDCHPPAAVLAKIAKKVWIGSEGLTCEWAGQLLGQYQLVDEDWNGSPLYAQEHSAAAGASAGKISYIYRSNKDDAWHIDVNKEDTKGMLYNPDGDEDSELPTTGWQVRKGEDGKMEEDDTLEIIEGTLPKCSAIKIVCKNEPKGAGTFHPTGKFVMGIQLFKNEETGMWLCQQPGTSVWCVTPDYNSTSAWVQSAASSICPANPRARQSDKQDISDAWQYMKYGKYNNGIWKMENGKKMEEWKIDSSIQVTCAKHSE